MTSNDTATARVLARQFIQIKAFPAVYGMAYHVELREHDTANGLRGNGSGGTLEEACAAALDDVGANDAE